MKKILILSFLSLSTLLSFAQDVHRTFGVGLQSSFPVFGISAKYGITENHMVQATIAPFGASYSGGSVKLNFYGARYIYRFPGNDESNPILDPYLFAGGGLATWKYNISGLSNSVESFFSYSAGGGLELLLAKKFGLSAELGYGKISVSSGVGVNTILYGGGLHYYIK